MFKIGSFVIENEVWNIWKCHQSTFNFFFSGFFFVLFNSFNDFYGFLWMNLSASSKSVWNLDQLPNQFEHDFQWNVEKRKWDEICIKFLSITAWELLFKTSTWFLSNCYGLFECKFHLIKIFDIPSWESELLRSHAV